MKNLTRTLLSSAIWISSFCFISTPVSSAPVKVGCIYQEGSFAKIAGYCTMDLTESGYATLTWPDGINTELKFELTGTSNAVTIDNKNAGKYSLGSDFYYIEYKTADQQRRKIFIVGTCIRCS